MRKLLFALTLLLGSTAHAQTPAYMDGSETPAGVKTPYAVGDLPFGDVNGPSGGADVGDVVIFDATSGKSIADSLLQYSASASNITLQTTLTDGTYTFIADKGYQVVAEDGPIELFPSSVGPGADYVRLRAGWLWGNPTGDLDPLLPQTTAAIYVDTADYSNKGFVMDMVSDTATDTSFISLRRARDGAAVDSGDILSELNTFGYDGTSYLPVTQVKVVVEENATTGDLPAKMVWSLRSAGAGSITERLTLDPIDGLLYNVTPVSFAGNQIPNTAYVDAHPGDISGPGSSTPNAFSTWNGSGGDALNDNEVTLDLNSNVWEMGPTNADRAFQLEAGDDVTISTVNGTIMLNAGSALDGFIYNNGTTRLTSGFIYNGVLPDVNFHGGGEGQGYLDRSSNNSEQSAVMHLRGSRGSHATNQNGDLLGRFNIWNSYGNGTDTQQYIGSASVGARSLGIVTLASAPTGLEFTTTGVNETTPTVRATLGTNGFEYDASVTTAFAGLQIPSTAWVLSHVSSNGIQPPTNTTQYAAISWATTATGAPYSALDSTIYMPPVSGGITSQLWGDDTSPALRLDVDQTGGDAALAAVDDLTLAHGDDGHILIPDDSTGNARVWFGDPVSPSFTIASSQSSGTTVLATSNEFWLLGAKVRLLGAGSPPILAIANASASTNSFEFTSNASNTEVYVNIASGRDARFTSTGGFTMLGDVRLDKLINYGEYTTAERDALTGEAESATLFNTDVSRLQTLLGGSWLTNSSLPTTTVEVFSLADLPTPGGGQIQLDPANYEMKAALSTPDSFVTPDVAAGGTFQMQADYAPGSVISYGGNTGLFLTDTNEGIVFFRLNNLITVMPFGGTIFDVTGTAPSGTQRGITAGRINDYASLFGTNIGTFDFITRFDVSNGLFSGYGGTGLVFSDIGQLFVDTIEFDSPATTAPGMTIKGDIITAKIDSPMFDIPLAPGAFRIDPGIPNDSRVEITRATVANGTPLFDTSGISGAETGTFTAVQDRSFSEVGGITSVTSGTAVSGGNLARFNINVPAFIQYPHQIVTIDSGGNTEYNGTYRIETTDGTGTVWFEVRGLLFGANMTGDVSSDRVELTEGATQVLDGYTLTIDQDDSTDYDGGATVYGAGVTLFLINREYTSGGTGTWSSAGLDQTDPRVVALSNPGFADSTYELAGGTKGNPTASTTQSSTWLPITFGVGFEITESTAIARWKLIDDTDGTFEYTGNEPFNGNIGAALTFGKGVSQADSYRFRLAVDTGGGFAPTPDAYEFSSTLTDANIALQVSFRVPVVIAKGDRVRIEQYGDGTGDDITVTEFVLTGDQ